MLLDQRKERIENQDAILGILSHISSNTDLISEIRDDQIAVIENLRTILEYVTEQKNSMPDERTLRFLDEEQIELVREKFIHETAQRIINTLQEDIPSIDHEEGLLKEMFGTYWDKLDTYTRKALISAKVFFANCNRATYAVLDYSGIIVSATSALENELKRRYFYLATRSTCLAHAEHHQTGCGQNRCCFTIDKERPSKTITSLWGLCHTFLNAAEMMRKN